MARVVNLWWKWWNFRVCDWLKKCQDQFEVETRWTQSEVKMIKIDEKFSDSQWDERQWKWIWNRRRLSTLRNISLQLCGDVTAEWGTARRNWNFNIISSLKLASTVYRIDGVSTCGEFQAVKIPHQIRITSSLSSCDVDESIYCRPRNDGMRGERNGKEKSSRNCGMKEILRGLRRMLTGFRFFFFFFQLLLVSLPLFRAAAQLYFSFRAKNFFLRTCEVDRSRTTPKFHRVAKAIIENIRQRAMLSFSIHRFDIHIETLARWSKKSSNIISVESQTNGLLGIESSGVYANWQQPTTKTRQNCVVEVRKEKSFFFTFHNFQHIFSL